MGFPKINEIKPLGVIRKIDLFFVKKIINRLLLLVFIGIVAFYSWTVIYARMKTIAIVEKALNSDRILLTLGDLSSQQRDELLKIQDPNFYEHKGVDMTTPGAGITTISQGLVKMYYFENFKPGVKKLKQILISRFAFDPLTPKDTILLLFINEVYLGESEGGPIKGLETGAQYYFNKNFIELNRDEYLALYAMIRAPFNYHFLNKRNKNNERVSRIKKMLSGEYKIKDNSDIFYDQD